MPEGFLKGLWGKPAQKGTGMMGLWGTITSTPKNLMSRLTSPLKLISTIVVVIVAFIGYKMIKK